MGSKLVLVGAFATEVDNGLALPPDLKVGDYVTLCTQHMTLSTSEEVRFTERFRYSDGGDPTLPIVYYDAFVDQAFLDEGPVIELVDGAGVFSFLHQGAILAAFRNVVSVTHYRGLNEFDPPFDVTTGSQPPFSLKFGESEILGRLYGAPLGDHEAAIVTLNQRNAGIIGGQIFGDDTGEWLRAEGIAVGRAALTTQYWDADPAVRVPIAPGLWRPDGAKPVVLGFITVLTVTSDRKATRQYPRDDALGLGSAPRLYPPPRARRIVGGYQ